MASEFSPGVFIDTSLRLGSLSVMTPGDNIRKHIDVVGSESLVTGSSRGSPFGVAGGFSNSKQTNSVTTCTTMISKGDDQVDSSTNLNLDFGLNLGHNAMSKDVKCLGFIPNTTEGKKLDIDIGLCLSNCLAYSDVTSITLASPSPAQSSTEMKAPTSHVSVQLVDEGSTSSKWRRGALGSSSECVNAKAFVVPNNPVAQPARMVSAPDLCTSQRRKTTVKACRFPGCEQGARGASGRCISHGGGRRCQRAGCHKGAEGKTAFCKAHGGGRRCDYLGCTKSAEGRTSRCIAHGGGRHCSYSEGCTRAARGRSGLCIRHGGGKRCKVENCTKSAEVLSIFCIAHGGGLRCQYPDCTKGAQGSTQFCKAHGGGKRCTFPGCSKGAEGITLFCKAHGGGKRCSFLQGDVNCPKSVHGGTLFCVAHGGGKRCAIPECTKSARGRTSFCVRHGGGKRCNHEGCGKSAQGGADFCKAHGGGKQCSWGQPGSGYGDDHTVPCNHLARGKIGLCAAHGAFVRDMPVRGNGTLSLFLHEREAKKIKQASMKDLMMIANNEESSSGRTGFRFTGFKLLPSPLSTNIDDKFLSDSTVVTTQGPVPEGRVHGGALMAML